MPIWAYPATDYRPLASIVRALAAVAPMAPVFDINQK